MKTAKIITVFLAGAVTGWALKGIQTPKRNSFSRINQKRVNQVADYYTTINKREEPLIDTEMPNTKDVTDAHQEEYFK
jgi:hypothetical protein